MRSQWDTNLRVHGDAWQQFFVRHDLSPVRREPTHQTSRRSRINPGRTRSLEIVSRLSRYSKGSWISLRCRQATIKWGQSHAKTESRHTLRYAHCHGGPWEAYGQPRLPPR